jgi:hypothetical protein
MSRNPVIAPRSRSYDIYDRLPEYTRLEYIKVAIGYLTHLRMTLIYFEPGNRLHAHEDSGRVRYTDTTWWIASPTLQDGENYVAFAVNYLTNCLQSMKPELFVT